MSARCIPFMDQFAAVILVTLAISASVGAVEAGVGDSRGIVSIPADAQCSGSSGTAVTMVPGGKAGFPKIPVLLVTSCNVTATQAQLFFLDVSTNPATRVKTITTTVTAANGWAALALRADKGDLLACTVVSSGQTDIYSIDFSPFNTIADGTATLLRHAPSGSTCAGIAWDPQGKTIYQSSTSSDILHFPETGTGALAPIPSGCAGTAGVGIAGTSLFVGCQSTTSVIPDVTNDPRTTRAATLGAHRTTGES